MNLAQYLPVRVADRRSVAYTSPLLLIVDVFLLLYLIEREHIQLVGGRLFQANIINTKGIIMIPVAINTGCMILKSSGTPIARR